jgi:hypothetical protein
MKRILCDKRNRLLPEHMCHLMRIAIEGPSVPNVRSATSSEVVAADVLIDAAYRVWPTKPRRGIE